MSHHTTLDITPRIETLTQDTLSVIDDLIIAPSRLGNPAVMFHAGGQDIYLEQLSRKRSVVVADRKVILRSAGTMITIPFGTEFLVECTDSGYVLHLW